MAYDYDIIVIGGGPAGYAGAIRAAQLKKRVLCVERDKLGGICLNWGCIPTKALLTNAHLVELIKNHGQAFGYSGQASWDFAQMIGRSRNVVSQMNRGIEGLFQKYKVASKIGTAKVIAPDTVGVNGEKVTAESIVIATGVRPRPLPGAEFDGKTIISYKEAMNLPRQPQSMLIIGGGPIGLEFGYFYNAIGTKVTLVELLDRILPGEDEEVSEGLNKSLVKRGLTISTSVKTGKVEKTDKGVKAEAETPKGKVTVEAEVMLVSIGVVGNVEGLFADNVKVEIFQNHIKVDPKDGYKTSVPGIYAVGDVACFPDPLFGRRRRIEHWSNANYQGAEVGKVLAGAGGGYDAVSSFFSEIFGTTIKVFGDVGRFDEQSSEGSLASGRLLTSYGYAGLLVGALTIGQSSEVETLVGELIREQAPTRPLHDDLIRQAVASG
jgi:dihydrolipoamide dehydrogenase